ncbi:MAG: hypothetical protein V7638_2492 [Acidobacteriota bacterium]|jgi:hypothetical protein
MYCPGCGQQQISDEMRFCSRCGLALSGLAEWMAGGMLPAERADETKVDPLSPRRKGIRRAAKLMFFSAVLVPVFLAISLIFDEGAPMLFPVVIFFVALVMMLYARLFSDTAAAVSDAHLNDEAAQTSALGSGSPRASLSPATTLPTPSLGRQQVRTNELAQPSSVTENTTRLLDNE